MGLLAKIVEDKRAEVARARRRLPEATLRTLLSEVSSPRGFARALRQGSGPHVISEVKRASPSKGVLRPHDEPGSWQPHELARAYERGGARALSVLTDVHYFWGHPDALLACREATNLPALRKDFVIDPYQIAESRWLGADAVLLIARILAPNLLLELAEQAQALSMDVLVEVHEASELPAALAVPHALIGINNRNLDTLQIDLARSQQLVAQIPQGRHVVAESGLSKPEDLQQMMRMGVDTFLIGESIARSDNPEASLSHLIGPD